jgi:hypothetical protein
VTPYERRKQHEQRALSQPSTRGSPHRESTTSTPRWVKVSGIIALVVVLLFVTLLVTRSPGGHGPGHHIPSGGSGGQARPPAS